MLKRTLFVLVAVSFLSAVPGQAAPDANPGAHDSASTGQERRTLGCGEISPLRKQIETDNIDGKWWEGFGTAPR